MKNMKKKGKQPEKYKAHIKTGDFYKYYANATFRIKEGNRIKIYRNSKYYVSRSKFTNIISDFNKLIRDAILKDNFDFRLPNRIGGLGIRKRRVKPYIDKNGEYINPLPPNWKATLKLWETDLDAKKNKILIRHTNIHSKGYIAEWVFFRHMANFKNKSQYSFIPCRTAKQMLSKIMKDELSNIDYYEK